MCRLLETIKVYSRKLCNPAYHNLRMNNSRKELFGCRNFIKLEDAVKIPAGLNGALHKCRVIYSETVKKIEFLPYRRKKINSLKIVHSNDIKYSYKYENRKCIDSLLKLKKECDDILIIKNNKITDTSFSNIVFYDGRKWITPSTPLLRGTKREKLLSDGKIIEDEIKISDLKHFKKAVLINAMLDFHDNVIDIKNIF